MLSNFLFINYCICDEYTTTVLLIPPHFERSIPLTARKWVRIVSSSLRALGSARFVSVVALLVRLSISIFSSYSYSFTRTHPLSSRSLSPLCSNFLYSSTVFSLVRVHVHVHIHELELCSARALYSFLTRIICTVLYAYSQIGSVSSLAHIICVAARAELCITGTADTHLQLHHHYHYHYHLHHFYLYPPAPPRRAMQSSSLCAALHHRVSIARALYTLLNASVTPTSSHMRPLHVLRLHSSISRWFTHVN